MKKNIFLIGGMGSGKTYIANKLSEKAGYNVFPFAGTIKNMLSVIKGRKLDKSLDRVDMQKLGEYLRTPLTKENYDEISTQIGKWMFQSREFRDWYSYNQGQAHQSNFWINMLYNDPIFAQNLCSSNVVIDDMRMVRENSSMKYFCEINNVDSLTVLVNVPKNIRINRLIERDGTFEPKWLENSSEQEHMNIVPDLIVDNYNANFMNGLSYADVDKIVDEILEGVS
jgi:dephospho-CoA kinase